MGAEYAAFCALGTDCTDCGVRVPPPPSSPWWTITSGTEYCSFTTGGACVTDGVGSHGNNERWTFTTTRALTLSVQSFVTETYFDYLQAGACYSTSSCQHSGSDHNSQPRARFRVTGIGAG